MLSLLTTTYQLAKEGADLIDWKRMQIEILHQTVRLESLFINCQLNPSFECLWNPDAPVCAADDSRPGCDRHADNHEWANCVRNGATAYGGVKP